MHLNHIHWAGLQNLPELLFNFIQLLELYHQPEILANSWKFCLLQNPLNRSFQMQIPSRPLDQCADGQPGIWFIGDLNVTSNLPALQQSSHLLDQFAATQAHTQRTQIGFLRSLQSETEMVYKQFLSSHEEMLGLQLERLLLLYGHSK